MKNTKIITLFLLLLSSHIYGASGDSINLNGEVPFACEVNMDPEPVASNLDLTTSQSHLKIFSWSVAANTIIDFTIDIPDGNKMYHDSVPSHYFEFDSADGNSEFSVGGVVLGTDSNTAQPIESSVSVAAGSPLGFVHTGEVFLNYTGVPALSLIQGTYSTTWYMGCSPASEPQGE